MVVAGINDKRRRGRLAVPPPTPHHLGKETRRETIRRLEKERGGKGEEGDHGNPDIQVINDDLKCVA